MLGPIRQRCHLYILRQAVLVSRFQPSSLCWMAQSQRSKGGGTLQSVAGDRVPLAHLVTADGDLVDHEASCVIRQTPP
jgi:hypothetical protein